MWKNQIAIFGNRIGPYTTRRMYRSSKRIYAMVALQEFGRVDRILGIVDETHSTDIKTFIWKVFLGEWNFLYSLDFVLGTLNI